MKRYLFRWCSHVQTETSGHLITSNNVLATHPVTLQMALNQTNLPLEPLQCELSLHLVLDPGIRTILPLQQGGPAVPRLSVSLHENDSDETLVL